MNNRSYIIILMMVAFTSTTFSQQGNKGITGVRWDPMPTVLEVWGIPDSGMQLGTGILGLGDVNGDGNDDFAVSARHIRNTFIYFGGAGILDDTADVSLQGGEGIQMGDVNADGRKDLIVSVPAFKLVDSVQINIYLGKQTTGFIWDTIPDVILYQTVTSGNIGKSLSVGDVNNDEYDDIVVGTPLHKGMRGRVRVYLGRTKIQSYPDFEQEGDSSTAEYGHKVDIADVNGDTIEDLIVSARRQEKGTVDIFYGKANFNFDKDNYDQRLSTVVAGVNYLYDFSTVDANADSIADINCRHNNDNTVYFFLGKNNAPLTSVPDFAMSPWEEYPFNHEAFDLGDINDDGKKDFGLLEPYCLNVYLGQKTTTKEPAGLRCVGNIYLVTGVGDVNGDGVNDVGVTEPYGVVDDDGYFLIVSGNKQWVTSVDRQKSQVLIPHSLEQNFPNPFNPSTTIEYTIQQRGEVTLAIYDAIGKEIRTMIRKEQSAGTHNVIWDGRDNNGKLQSTGTYFYRLYVDGSFSETKKLILIK